MRRISQATTNLTHRTGPVDTRIGRLDFELDLPTQETVAKLFDEMDFQRACQLYLWALKAFKKETL